MKIPRYTSRAISQQIRPGTPLRGTVRMNPQAMAQAELAKAEPMQALLDGATKFAATRWQASQEAQYNEAALAIEEGMREAEYTLGKSTDIYNVLDGENNWQSSMDELRDVTIASVGNRSLRRKLSYAFEQNEIAARFRLRGVIDKKILAREQAAMAARMERDRVELSTPGPTATIENYNQRFGIIVNDQAKAVAGGRYSIAGVNKANLKLRTDIAEGYIAATFGDDPNAVLQLSALLDLQDEVNKGDLTEEQAMEKAKITDSYALHVLYNIDRQEAERIIANNITASIKIFDAQQKLKRAEETEENNRNKEAYHFVLSVDPSTNVPPETMQQLIPDYYYNSLDADQKGVLSGSQAKELLRKYLNDVRWADATQQRRMDAEIDPESRKTFALPETADELLYSQLYAEAGAGMLDAEKLESVKNRITLGQYTQIIDRLQSRGDQNYNVGSKLLAREFHYSEIAARNGDQDDLAQASKAAFERADAALIREVNRRKADKNPMSIDEVLDFVDKQIKTFGEFYREELRKEYEFVLQSFEQNRPQGSPPLTIDRSNPIQSINDWRDTLNETQLNNEGDNIDIFLSRIRAFSNKGLF